MRVGANQPVNKQPLPLFGKSAVDLLARALSGCGVAYQPVTSWWTANAARLLCAGEDMRQRRCVTNDSAQQLVENIPLPALVHDTNFEILAVNRACGTSANLSRTYSETRDIFAFVHPTNMQPSGRYREDLLSEFARTGEASQTPSALRTRAAGSRGRTAARSHPETLSGVITLSMAQRCARSSRALVRCQRGPECTGGTGEAPTAFARFSPRFAVQVSARSGWSRDADAGRRFHSGLTREDRNQRRS